MNERIYSETLDFINTNGENILQEIRDLEELIMAIDMIDNGQLEKNMRRNAGDILDKLYKLLVDAEKILNVKIPLLLPRMDEAKKIKDELVMEGVEVLREYIKENNKKIITQEGWLKIDLSDKIVGLESIKEYLFNLPTQGRELIGGFTFRLTTYAIVKDDAIKIHDSVEKMYDEIIDRNIGKAYWSIKDILEIRLFIVDFDVMEDIDILESLLAYGSISDRDFQNKTLYSMSAESRICIYWSYLLINDKVQIKRGSKVENLDSYILTMLNDEPIELRRFAKEGKLHDFLKYVTKRDNINYYLYVHNLRKFYKYFVDDKNDISIESLDKIDDEQKCFYYYFNHVAVSNGKKLRNIEHSGFTKQRIILNPILQSCTHKLVNKEFHFYDIESYTNGQMSIICSVKYDEENQRYIGKHFDDVDIFAHYIDSLSFKNNKKTRPTKKILYHDFYGHNASNYDMIYIFQALNHICRLKNFINNGNSIKGFTYGTNIEFKDSNLMITGQLEKLTKEVFKLKVKTSELPYNYYNLKPDEIATEEKESYPYTFLTKENIDYIGEVPHWKYFGRNDDTDKVRKERYERCLKAHQKAKRKFNLKEYTIYYCYLDCILGHKMIMKYRELNIVKPSVKGSIEELANEIKDVRRTLFKSHRPKLRQRKNEKIEKFNERIKLDKEMWDEKLKYLLNNHPEFKGLNMNNKLICKVKFLKFARKRIYFDPLHYKTKSSETLARFSKLFNMYEVYSIPDLYEPLIRNSYGGGVCDVYKKKWENKNTDIDKNYENLSEKEFNKYMDNIVKNSKSEDKLHKDDINSSYPSVMTKSVPIKFWYERNCRYTFNSLKDIEQLKDTNLYIISYEYEDDRVIPNIYVRHQDKFMGLKKNNEIPVWGDLLKQSLKQHLLNDIKKHGCSTRFKTIKIHKELVFY
jgi:hypothetical protein